MGQLYCKEVFTPNYQPNNDVLFCLHMSRYVLPFFGLSPDCPVGFRKCGL